MKRLHPSPPLTRFALGCLLALLVYGCGARQPIVYYNLTPLVAADKAPAPAAPSPPLAIGIGPVLMPEALSRAQIASRLDPQSLKYHDAHRWGSPLAEDFAGVLREDIAAQLPAPTVISVFPWGSYFQPTHRLILDVSRFDGKLGGEVVLAVRWTITNGTGKETIAAHKSTIRIQAAGDHYQDLVTAQSQAVAELSKEIAAALVGQ